MKKNKSMICNEIEVEDSFEFAQNVNVYHDGLKKSFACGSDEYVLILDEWKELIVNARNMPAYGVSLHGETVEAMKSGVWVEFDYGKTYYSGGMNYDKLLINIGEKDSGFNLIRHNERGYDGRCFYFDIDGDTSKYYNLLVDL